MHRYLLSWKVAPALLMGNAIIAKPSEMTPLTATLLAEVCHRIGLPVGILNIVHGLGAEVGSPIVGHPDIRAISFTGGTATGKIVAASAAPMFKKLSLELGGKNATIVLDDADVDTVVPMVVRAGFANQGQICLCGSRILIADAIYDEVRDKIVAAVLKMTVGDPRTCDMGSLISTEHRDKVEGYVKLAQEEGGKVLTGGCRPSPELPGAFLRPTVIDGLDIHSRTATEEIFGPVVTLHR
jgi:aminomuconate-semialdehyde/2-hydroxymuconate-6-semialdehyde dehydrogenase